MEARNGMSNMNVFQKMIGVFTSPRETFTAIDQKPDWIAPMIVIIIITLIFTMITMPIQMPEQMQKQREKLEERGMSDEEIDQALATGEKIGKIFGPVGALIAVPVMLLLFSLLFWFVGNIILGGQTSFKKMFSVYTYTSLIGTVGLLIKLPIIVSKQSADVHFSLATFLSPDKSESLLYTILKNFEVFNIWHYVVLAIGFSVVYKFSMKKAGWTMAVMFILSILVTVAWSQIFG